jgi:hypothetical protein
MYGDNKIKPNKNGDKIHGLSMTMNKTDNPKSAMFAKFAIDMVDEVTGTTLFTAGQIVSAEFDEQQQVYVLNGNFVLYKDEVGLWVDLL